MAKGEQQHRAEQGAAPPRRGPPGVRALPSPARAQKDVPMQGRDDTTHAGQAAPPQEPVVLFDGVCALCDGFVSFMLRIDRRGRYRFAPLQGETARAYLSSVEPPPDSIVLCAHGRLYFRSGAVLRILAGLGGVWRAALLLLLVPSPLRDAAYDFIAARRYGWFGKYDACRLPTPEQAHRFLD